MPRAPRLELAGVPLHIVQRSVNRCAVFLCNEDRGFYLGLLARAFRAEVVALHAYVLMGDHLTLQPAPRRLGSMSTSVPARRLSTSAPFVPQRGPKTARDRILHALALGRRGQILRKLGEHAGSSRNTRAR